jgi:outer membrane protein TolC
MNRKAKPISLVFFVCITFSAFGQQSMLPDVSYPYLQKLIGVAKVNYPKVQAFQHKVSVAKINVNKAKLNWFDVLTFTYQYSPNNTTTLTNPSYLNGYQFGVFINVGSLLQKHPNVKIAKEDLTIAKLEEAEYELNIEAMVKQRYFLYISQLALLRVKTQAASDAEAALKDVKYRYEKGEALFDDYNKSLINYSDKVESKIETEGAMLIAKSSLEEMLGKKLEEIN